MSALMILFSLLTRRSINNTIDTSLIKRVENDIIDSPDEVSINKSNNNNNDDLNTTILKIIFNHMKKL
jgi:hypothetical protein